VTTINARIAEGRHRLLGAGINQGESALDARLLAQAVLGWDTTRMLTSGDELEPAAFAAQYDELIARRAHREPLPYITGTREFWNLTFEVSPAVLIPRPETEGLVEAVNELFPDRDAPLRAADVCTGSGCVAVAIAFERRQARIVAADASAAALEIAHRNTQRHGVTDRVECQAIGAADGAFDLIWLTRHTCHQAPASTATEVRDHGGDGALLRADRPRHHSSPCIGRGRSAGTRRIPDLRIWRRSGVGRQVDLQQTTA
jgi:methylase of polypeptide subunit release factors